MEKETETVLEIEFQPVFDEWAWKITKQNEEILERNNFKDEELDVASSHSPCFEESFLFVKGVRRCYDGIINICTSEEKTLIEEKVKAINEKYGIAKRWRAEYSKNYFYINEMFKIKFDTESYWDIDDKRYENGNYFRTEQDAKEYMEYMKQCSHEWHEKRGNNE